MHEADPLTSCPWDLRVLAQSLGLVQQSWQDGAWGLEAEPLALAGG